MFLHATRSDRLLKICAILLHLLTFATANTNQSHPEEHNATLSEPLQSDASEHVGKILNLPVTLNFDDEPLNRSVRGNYGGHQRNDEEVQKADDGQFGARIILGIVHSDDKTTTPPSALDQKESQTIVKYFDKEDYDGIKTNPIIVDDQYEQTDTDQNTKTRNRKEILALKQEKSPLDEQEERFQKNEDNSGINEENENEDLIRESSPNEDDERAEINENRQEQQSEEHEDEELRENKEDEAIKETVENSKEEDDAPLQKYEEYIVPANHRPTYSEIEYPENYDKTHSEEDVGKLTDSKEPSKDYDGQLHQVGPSELSTHDASLKNHQDEESPPKNHHHEESSNVSDENERLSQNDQKGGAAHTHEETKKKKTGEKHAAGKGEEKHEEEHGEKGNKGDKKYEGYHEVVKGKKGHHDEEQHEKNYADKGGQEKKHQEDTGHHGEYYKGEKGEKGSKFAEEGKHSKGHSTKGEHNIHKKDEYEKNQEFYDEHHEGGEHEKHGGFHHENDYKKVGHKKLGHHKKGDHVDHYGKKSLHEEGHFYDEKDGKKKASGHNQHHDHHASHGKKSVNSGKKHWGHKKGSGGGGHKKHKEGQQVAHSNLQQVRKVPPVVHKHHKNEGEQSPHYNRRFHVPNDDTRSGTVHDHVAQHMAHSNLQQLEKVRPAVHKHYKEEREHYPNYNRRFDVGNDDTRSDTVDDQEEIITTQKLQDKNVKTKQNQLKEKEVDEEDEDVKSDSKESGERSKQLYYSNSNEHEAINKQEDVANEELDNPYLPQSSIIHEKKKPSKNLPKIYVILPNDFDEQIQKSAENSDSSSIERESSYEDSEEEKSRPKTIHKKYTKLVEPVEAPSFPKEHKKRLSDMEYVIHKIGAELGKNMENNNSQRRVNDKTRREDSGESDKFSFSGSSEER